MARNNSLHNLLDRSLRILIPFGWFAGLLLILQHNLILSILLIVIIGLRILESVKFGKKNKPDWRKVLKGLDLSSFLEIFLIAFPILTLLYYTRLVKFIFLVGYWLLVFILDMIRDTDNK